ncbi:MAG: sugar phosphate isomerase/epimerase [Micrococcales bacterium]|nr:sugar phosphate isomerase/epimerase [Micrococcales bacterium]
MSVTSVPRPSRVTLSTSSVYPLGPAAAFEAAAQHGYDGVEVMILTDPISQDVAALTRLGRTHGIPVTSIHAPTLLVTQRVYGTSDPWAKLDKTIDLALELECDTIVLHPPFRWQKDYAASFVDGVATREHERDIKLAVENMFPWRARQTQLQAYLPAWDPVPQPYDNVTIDLSHAATAGSDVLAMADALGARLAHVHLADGSGSMKDEHLVPGRGGQPCAQFLQTVTAAGYRGDVAVEVNTRRAGGKNRHADLAESLAFARRNLRAPRRNAG